MFTKWIREISDKHSFSFNENNSGKHAAFATWSGKIRNILEIIPIKNNVKIKKSILLKSC